MASFTRLAAQSAHLHAAEVIQELGHHKAGLGFDNSDVVLQVHGSLQGALLGPPASCVGNSVHETGWPGAALAAEIIAALPLAVGPAGRAAVLQLHVLPQGLLGPPAIAPQWHMICA